MKNNVSVKCEKCKELLIVDNPEYFGQDGECSVCKNDIYIPFPEPDELEVIRNRQEKRPNKNHNKVRCPYCAEIISKEAIKCKHCKELLVKPKKKTGCFTIFVAVIFAFVLFIVILAAISPSDNDNLNKIYAINMTEKFVKDRLRSPASADFSNMEAIQMSNGNYLISGKVDSQNGFGAKIRNNIHCVLSVSGDTWKVVTLNFKK